MQQRVIWLIAPFPQLLETLTNELLSTLRRRLVENLAFKDIGSILLRCKMARKIMRVAIAFTIS